MKQIIYSQGSVTPKEFALMHHVHYNTVYFWIKNGMIPYENTPAGISNRYRIPFVARPPFLKPGPRRKKGDTSIANVIPVSHNHYDKIREINRILLENQITIDDLLLL